MCVFVCVCVCVVLCVVYDSFIYVTYVYTDISAPLQAQ